ncbi:MAG: fibronectin type III domain-containing protein, partial [Pseudomonadota bacterium]
MRLSSTRLPRSSSTPWLLLLLLIAAGAASASDRSPPLSWDGQQRSSIHAIETAAFGALDLDSIAQEDQLNQAFGQPPRFAMPHAVSISPLLHGEWTERGDVSIWRYRVTAEVATSLNFGFDQVFMPEGAQLYLYTVAAANRGDMDVYEVLGPYGIDINEVHRQFWTPIIQGKDVVIELNVPTDVRDQVSLELTSVNQGYRGFGEALEGYYHTDQLFGEGKQSGGDCAKDGAGGRSGSCNMDVACLADDDPWNDPRRAVGAYTRSGTDVCTGSLVNNTAGDRRMLFATATHCGNLPSNAPSVVVYWNYEWPTCRTPGDPIGTQVGPRPDTINSGAIVLANTDNPFNNNPQLTCSAPGNCSDWALLELDDPANPEFDLFWAGWDRRDDPAQCAQIGTNGSTEGLCASIHHPGVDEKRITFVPEDFFTDNISNAVGVHWRARWHTDPPIVGNIPAPQPTTIPPGVTEQGSSGSPLYSSQQRIVGVLSGGPAFCGATGGSLSDLYGKLEHAWEGLGTPTTRMRDYLDPQNTNAEFIDGIGVAPFQLAATPNNVAACASDGSVDITIDVTPDPGFNSAVTLAVNGEPTNASTGFSANPVNPPGSSVLTIGNLGGATEGNYSVQITGTSGDDETSTTVPFSLASTVPVGPTLVAPGNGDTGTSTSVQLSWQAIPNATEYEVELATNPDFVNAVLLGPTSDTQVDAAGLNTVTIYYWRVTGRNSCGDGAQSETFTFTTANQFCSAPGTPLLDPDNGGGSVFDSIVIPQAGPSTNVVLEVNLGHTFIGDTRLVLTHVDSDTSITVYDRPGVPTTQFGCAGNNVAASFSDDASVLAEDECEDETPGLSGSFLPIDAMATFDGLPSNAEWRLE